MRSDGWFEAKLTGKLLQASYEEVIRRAYAIMERYGYRNYMITENPEYVIAVNGRIVIPGYPAGTVVAEKA